MMNVSGMKHNTVSMRPLLQTASYRNISITISSD